MNQEVNGVIKAELRLQGVREEQGGRAIKRKLVNRSYGTSKRGSGAGASGACLCTGFRPMMAQVGKGQCENAQR